MSDITFVLYAQLVNISNSKLNYISRNLKYYYLATRTLLALTRLRHEPPWQLAKHIFQGGNAHERITEV